MSSNSSVKHGFTFTPATPIFVECESEPEPELDTSAAKLGEGGQVMMSSA